MMNADEMEDYLDLRDPGLKKHIRRSQEQYRRGKARDATLFVSGLRRAGAKRHK